MYIYTEPSCLSLAHAVGVVIDIGVTRYGTQIALTDSRLNDSWSFHDPCRADPSHNGTEQV